jgi:folate-binding protein YgfZ
VQATSIDERARALDVGLAYAELDDVTLTTVSGGDARGWLGDLATTDIASLGRFEARPSLLLTPTGRIRASFHVLGLGERDFVLAQGPGQPAPIGDLLRPYVLSSDVTVGPSRLRLFALPGRVDPPAWAAHTWRPSVLGDGVDLLVGASDEEALGDVRGRLEAEGLAPVEPDAVEARRVRRGEARFPIDVDVDSLPAEAGWDSAPVTDRAKGCFLGQEAVAKVANLGHPPRIVIAVAAATPLAVGEPVLADGREVGRLTSANGRFAIARIRWEARAEPLAAREGVRLERR